MSSESIEIVRRSFAAWNSDDWETLELLYDPNVVAQAPEEWPELGPLHGFGALRKQFVRNKDSWDQEHVEVDELRQLGRDEVLAQIRWVTKGRQSGIALETMITEVLTVSKGRISRVEFYLGPAEEALPAERLRQPSASPTDRTASPG